MTTKNIKEVVFTEDQYDELNQILYKEELGTIHKTQLFADCFEDNLDLFNAWKEQFLTETITLSADYRVYASQYDITIDAHDIDPDSWDAINRGDKCWDEVVCCEGSGLEPHDADLSVESVDSVDEQSRKPSIRLSYDQYLITTGQKKVA